jgi:hypothetical protein
MKHTVIQTSIEPICSTCGSVYVDKDDCPGPQEQTSRDRYNDAWTKLLAARRSGTLGDVGNKAYDLMTIAYALAAEPEPQVGPCSHFMIVNGHCINCHEIVGTKSN